MKEQKQVGNILTELIHAQDINNLHETNKILKVSKLRGYISELKITTESVVAKVSFVTNKAIRRVVVIWGDLEYDEISVFPGFSIAHSPEFGLPISLSDRIHYFLHVYDKPKDCRAFGKHLTLRIQDHSGNIVQCSTKLTLTP